MTTMYLYAIFCKRALITTLVPLSYHANRKPKMVSRIKTYFTFAVVLMSSQVHGRVLTADENNNDMQLAREGSIELNLSLLSTVVLSVAKIIWGIVSTVWSLAGYKLTAFALVAKIISWVFHSGLTAVISAIIVIGFCNFTGLCGMSYFEQGLLEVDDTLDEAARNLEDGISKFATL